MKARWEAVMVWPRSWLSPRASGFFLVGPGTREHVRHGVISLVARVLVKPIGAFLHGQLDGPGLGINGGIVDRGSIDDGVGIRAAEAFHHVQIFVRHSIQVADSEAALVVEFEISAIDNQRVAFPTAA